MFNVSKGNEEKKKEKRMTPTQLIKPSVATVTKGVE